MAEPRTPEVLVLPGAWEHVGLTEQLGETRTGELGAWMLERACAWAIEAWGREAVRAVTGPTKDPEQFIAGAIARLDPGRPLIIAVPELASWRPATAAALLDDLADGCIASIGPVFDGGFYALALAEPHPAILELSPETWSGRHALTAIFDAAGQADLLVGMVRSERALRRPGDVRSLLADPLLDDELRALLR